MSDETNLSHGTVVQQYSNGAVLKFSLDDGYTFEAYVPNGCTSDTAVTIYEHGDGGYYNDWNTYQEKFAKDGCSSIIIRADRNQSTELYNHIKKIYNLTPKQNMTVSFSGGTSYAIKETVDMIKQNPNGEPPVAVLLDGYVPTGYLVSDGTVDTLIKGNALILAFGRAGGSTYYNQYLSLAKAGANVVIFKDLSSYGYSHRGMNNSYMEGGLLEYTLGEGELPNRYEISVYDSSKRQFVSLDYSQVSTLDKVYTLFGIDTFKMRIDGLLSLKNYEITSDRAVINDYLNNIINTIKSSSFLNLNFNSSFNSTTNVPTAVPTCVKRYFNSISQKLINLSNFIDIVSQIDPTYQQLDEKLQKIIDENLSKK